MGRPSFTRRDFLRALGIGAGSAALPGCAGPRVTDDGRKAAAPDASPGTSPGARAGDAPKPNIVLFFVDDNVVETIMAGGLCPNIRGLGEKGVTFTRAYTPHGVCGPARYAVLSGRYACRWGEETCTTPESRVHGSKSLGALTVEGQVFAGRGHILSAEWNVAKLLKLAGYATFYAGKVHGHMQDAEVGKELALAAKTDPRKKQEMMRRKLRQAGWDHAEALSSGNLTSRAKEKAGIKAGKHCPEWRAQAAIDFIERNKDGPFFCYIAENLMHMPPPWDDLKADPRHACDGIVLDRAPEVMPPRESVLRRVKEAGLDERQSAALLWLDDMVGAVLGKLEELGLRENTLVVFMQDNGHHFEGKNTAYEGGIHVSPTYLSWPAGVGRPGRECGELVSSLDLVPTFMEAAGVTPPDDLVLDGLSLMPLIGGGRDGGPDKPLRDSLYAEMGHTRAVVTKRWKYIAFRVPPSREFDDEEKRIFEERAERDETGMIREMGCRVTHMQGSTPGYVPPSWYAHPDHFFDADQLYDLKADPEERVNLAGEARHAGVLADMKKRLREYCLELPGTFAELKTVDDCPPEFGKLLAEARERPLVPVSKKRKLTDKMPKRGKRPVPRLWGGKPD